MRRVAARAARISPPEPASADRPVLAYAQRLRSTVDFASVARHGARAGSRLLVVQLLDPGPDSGMSVPARGGFIVSKGVGNAVTRNRVARRLRHLASPRLLDLPEGSRMVVRALPASAGASSTDLGIALDRCLSKIRTRASRDRT